MRDQIFAALSSLAAVAIPAIGAWLAFAGRRYLAQRTYASHVETIRVRARAVAADMQRDVDDAKDPAAPGDWTRGIALDVRRAAVARVRRLEPLACKTILEALDGDSAALDDLIGGHVEEAVRAMRAASPASSAPKPPAPPPSPLRGTTLRMAPDGAPPDPERVRDTRPGDDAA